MNSRTITPEFKNTPWTNTEMQTLRSLLKKRMTGSQIASILKRTISSIHSKAYGMKMSIRRNRPPLGNEEFNRRYERHMAKGTANVNAEA